MVSLDAMLWGAAVLTYGLGDYVTTVIGVKMAGVQEGNPIVRLLSGGDPGPASFAVLKLVSVGLFFGVYWLFRPAFVRIFVPLALTLLGIAVTGKNVQVIRRRR
ncbi:DUF5658 family protein [Haloferax namakaokahaiae]|uniref:DUF5658 family protein n=1 Tax=Haloferax namakaokahaiae TaxID=1748331 RepID=A0ABD5ZI14_9EURY